MKIKSIEPINELKYLRSYKIKYATKSGQERDWEIVSRGDTSRLKKEIFNHQSFTDGAMVFATNLNKTDVIMLKEFRVSAGRPIYMFPAGLIESGEDIKNAAKREFNEETGLHLTPLYVERERYVSVGIINERVNVVYGTYSGIPTKDFQEDSEDADIIIVDKSEARRILEEEEISIRSAMLLQNFFKIHPFFDIETS
ncbi:MAG: NUDIX hydrolase [Clostridiales bacterium]|nr:NUDIX hydrolase [Clostridiales bacterium]